MYIRCPHCGRKGYLPDRLAPEANSLRCRRCKAHFLTPELSQQALANEGGAGSGRADGFSTRSESRAFFTDGYFGGYDDNEPARPHGPGDSSYELIFTLQDTEGDSGDDWEAGPLAGEVEAPSSDEVPALSATPASPRARDVEPWHHRFIESWGMVCVGAVVAMIAVVVPLEAYLIWRSFTGGSGVALTATVAGLACALALLVVAVPLLLLATSLPELVRDIRGLRERIDRRA